MKGSVFHKLHIAETVRPICGVVVFHPCSQHIFDVLVGSFYRTLALTMPWFPVNVL
jgi:hypothetical protein